MINLAYISDISDMNCSSASCADRSLYFFSGILVSLIVIIFLTLFYQLYDCF